jgi:hypothetical protein
MTRTQVKPQQELRTLNCQPSSDDTNKIHPSTIPQSQLDGSNYFRKYEGVLDTTLCNKVCQ